MAQNEERIFSDKEIKDLVQSRLSEELGINKSDVLLSYDLHSDLAVNSLDLMNMIAWAEYTFKIDLDVDFVDENLGNTVDDFAKMIIKSIKNKN